VPADELAVWQAHMQIRQQLGDDDFSRAVFDVWVAREISRQRRQPRDGPEGGIDL